MNLGTSKSRVVLIAFLITVAVSYLYYSYVISPKLSQIKEKKVKLKKLEKVFNMTKNKLHSDEELKSWFEYMKLVDRKLDMLLPPQEDATVLLKRISEAGRLTGASLEGFKPLSSEEGDFYMANHYLVSLKASYHDVGKFLARIANEERVLTVSSLKLSPVEESAESQGLVSAEFVLTSYNRIATR